VLAKHSKSFSLIDCISVGVDRMQRNFGPMRKQVETWQRSELTDVIDKERRIVITTAWDRVTFAEGKAHQDKLKSDPDFSPEFNQPLDATKVTALEITPEEARRIAQGSLFFSPSSRRAWVAPTPFIVGMARMVQIHREIAGAKEQFRVFYDRNEALKWLGLDTLPQ
jgi:hypothetical protein